MGNPLSAGEIFSFRLNCIFVAVSPLIILESMAGYFGILLLIAWITSRNANNDSYYTGNKASPWYAVAFGMIGDSLSGVTFISLPGTVMNAQFFLYADGFWATLLWLCGYRPDTFALVLPA